MVCVVLSSPTLLRFPACTNKRYHVHRNSIARDFRRPPPVSVWSAHETQHMYYRISRKPCHYWINYYFSHERFFIYSVTLIATSLAGAAERMDLVYSLLVGLLITLVLLALVYLWVTINRVVGSWISWYTEVKHLRALPSPPRHWFWGHVASVRNTLF